MEENNQNKQSDENIDKEEYLDLKRSNEKKKATIVILIFLIILMAFLIIIFFYSSKPPQDGKKENGNNNGVVNSTPTQPASRIDIEKASTGLMKLITDFPGVMPISLDDTAPASYTINDLSNADKSNIIFSYAYIIGKDERNSSCKESNGSKECHISVLEISSKVGIEIGNNFEKDNYVKEFVKNDNDDYYRVIVPITSWEEKYDLKNCNPSNTNDKLTISCSIFEVINPYDPYEEKEIGTGSFVYNISDKVSFEKFVYEAKN